MIIRHILPELTSPKSFLRSKACLTFSKFSTLEFQNQQVFTECLDRVFVCMKDNCLGVKLFAGISLRDIIQNPLAREIVQKYLEPLLNGKSFVYFINFLFILQLISNTTKKVYIELITEVDNEEIIESMEYLISEYKSQIAPFACKLVLVFMKSFERVVGNDSDDSIAAWECLRAVKIVLGTIEKFPDQFKEVENIIMPIISKYFTSDNDYFEDFLQIISTVATCSEFVSDTLWNLFPVISSACLEWAIDYIKEILFCFDNMICSDPAGFIARNYITYIIQIYELVSNIL